MPLRLSLCFAFLFSPITLFQAQLVVRAARFDLATPVLRFNAGDFQIFP